MAKGRELAPAVTLSDSLRLLLASPHHLFCLPRGLQKAGQVGGESFHVVLGAREFCMHVRLLEAARVSADDDRCPCRTSAATLQQAPDDTDGRPAN